jgi:hypothetical protein
MVFFPTRGVISRPGVRRDKAFFHFVANVF